MPQLRYLAKRDFTPVRLAATKALEALGKSVYNNLEWLVIDRMLLITLCVNVTVVLTFLAL